MSFLDLPDGVENIILTGRGSGKKPTSIFESSKEKVVSDLTVGIREAEGRYKLTDENFQGAAAEDHPVMSKRLDKHMDKPYASTCWRPQTIRLDPKDVTQGYIPKTDHEGNELVLVYIKCKGAKVVGLLKDMAGNPATELQINSKDLVQTLEGYKEVLSAMEKDSALGKFWHDIAIYNSFPPKQRESKLIGTMAHCLEADAWVKKEDVKEKSPYPTKPIQSRKG